jgi:hypothetical protein
VLWLRPGAAKKETASLPVGLPAEITEAVKWYDALGFPYVKGLTCAELYRGDRRLGQGKKKDVPRSAERIVRSVNLSGW